MPLQSGAGTIAISPVIVNKCRWLGASPLPQMEGGAALSSVLQQFRTVEDLVVDLADRLFSLPS